MPFAQSSYGVLRYVPETTPGTTPGAGNGITLRMTDSSMKAAIATAKSDEVQGDRLAPGSFRTDLNISGGFDFELSAKEYDPFFEGLLGNSMNHYGTLGFGTSFSMTSVAGTITAGAAPTGSSAFTGLGLGEWFKVVPPVGATQAVKDYFADAWFKTHASTPASTTVVTLDASTPIVAPGIVTAVAGYSISRSFIVNGTTFKSFSMEYNQSDINEFYLYRGMRPGNLDLSIEVGKIISGSFGFTGMSHASTQATSLPGSPVASQTFDQMNAVTDVGTIYEAGTNLLSSGSFIKSIKLAVNNNLRGQKAIQTFGNADIGYGELQLSGALEVYMPNAAYYRKWLAGTNTTLAIGMADGLGNGYLLDFDKVTFRDVDFNPGGRNDDAMLSLPFDCFRSPTNGTRGIRITRGVVA